MVSTSRKVSNTVYRLACVGRLWVQLLLKPSAELFVRAAPKKRKPNIGKIVTV
jgi:hypothetical protein